MDEHDHDHGHGQDEVEEPCVGNCLPLKWAFTAVILVVGILGGLAPILIQRVSAASRARRKDDSELDQSADAEMAMPAEEYGREDRILRLAELFSGGVLFGVAVFHLIPEGLEPLQSFEGEETHGFPLGLAVFSMGFLITVGLETVAVPLLFEYRRARKQDHGSDAGHSLLSAKQANDTYDVESPTASTSEYPEQDAIDTDHVEYPVSSTSGTPDHEEHGHIGGCETALVAEAFLSKDEIDKSWRSLGTAAATFVGLSMHALFAGLSLGIGPLNQAIFLFVAIISHKAFGTFAIGLQLVRAKVSLLTHISVVTAFALITPLGIVIGLAAHDSVDSFTAGILQLIAAGMLFAVAVVGSLGFDAGENKRAAANGYLSYVAGVLSMGIIFVTLAFTGVLESGHAH